MPFVKCEQPPQFSFAPNAPLMAHGMCIGVKWWPDASKGTGTGPPREDAQGENLSLPSDGPPRGPVTRES